MHIIPTQDEVVTVLRDTGALRDGHFEYPSGLHSNEYLQVPLAMRYYQHQRMLSVGLSRLLRANPEIRAIIPELSIVSPMTGGLPVAYGVTEALRAQQVYWAEREHDNEAAAFSPVPGTAAGRAGGARRRHSAHRHQTARTEDAAGIARRYRGRAGRDHLPADTQTPTISAICRSTTWPSWTHATTPTLRIANCASAACPWRRSGYKPLPGRPSSGISASRTAALSTHLTRPAVILCRM